MSGRKIPVHGAPSSSMAATWTTRVNTVATSSRNGGNVESKSLSSPGTSTNSMTLTTPPDSEGEEERQQVAQEDGQEDSLSSTETSGSTGGSSEQARWHRRRRTGRKQETASLRSSEAPPKGGTRQQEEENGRRTARFADQYERSQRQGHTSGQRQNAEEGLDNNEAHKEAMRLWPWLFGHHYSPPYGNTGHDEQRHTRSSERSPYIEALNRLALQRSSMGMAGDVERSLAAETRLDFARNIISRYTEMSVLYEHYYMEQANAVAEIIDSSIGTSLTGDMPRNSLSRRKRLARSAGLHPIAATSRYGSEGENTNCMVGGPRLPSYAALPPDVQASMKEAVESLAEQQSRYDMRPAALSVLELALDRQRTQERDTQEKERLRKEAEEAQNFISRLNTDSRRRRHNRTIRSKDKRTSKSPWTQSTAQQQLSARDKQQEGVTPSVSQRRSSRRASASTTDDSISSSLTPIRPRTVAEFDGFRKRVQQRLNQSLRSYETLKSSWNNFAKRRVDDADESDTDIDASSEDSRQYWEPPREASSGGSQKENYPRRERRRSSFESLNDIYQSAESIRDGLKQSRSVSNHKE
eukprot:gb/GECG01000633.1/.p1 GENE.gb/GECG01000633.1/~~gb/GECG01000633.1/.p1  ORF type:complete len:583 (+),score=93.84 gb/GECG01000633.1/:1-1749(+)